MSMDRFDNLFWIFFFISSLLLPGEANEPEKTIWADHSPRSRSHHNMSMQCVVRIFWSSLCRWHIYGVAMSSAQRRSTNQASEHSSHCVISHSFLNSPELKPNLENVRFFCAEITAASYACTKCFNHHYKDNVPAKVDSNWRQKQSLWQRYIRGIFRVLLPMISREALKS